MQCGIRCPRCGKFRKDLGRFTDMREQWCNHSGCPDCKITFDWRTTGYLGESGCYFDASYAFNIKEEDQ
jgi:hypothetical protein